MATKLKITLSKSLIGRLEAQVRTANSLGLRKIGDVTLQANNVQVKGKINVISHLVTVSEE